MKIVYCINNTWYSGGMTRVLSNKVNYLVKIGFDVTIITTDQIGMNDHYNISPLVKRLDFGINYLGCDTMPIWKKIYKIPYKMILNFFKLKRSLNELKPDITISMFLKEVYFLPFINDGSAKILELHTSRANWLYSRKKLKILGNLLNKIDDFITNQYHKFVVLTNEDKMSWSKVSNIEVIPNSNTFEPSMLELSNLNNKIAIAVGRYGEEKRFEDLIDCWRLVNKKYKSWKLRIIGDGVMRGDLQNLIDLYQLNNVIKLVPTKSSIEEEYINSSMVLLSSKFEGLGMTLLEGQSYGVPLIAYACKCGPSDIIDDGVNGYLIKDGDVSDMARKICFLIENDRLRHEMGINAKLNSKKFSEDVVMKKWVNVFDDVTK